MGTDLVVGITGSRTTVIDSKVDDKYVPASVTNWEALEKHWNFIGTELGIVAEKTLTVVCITFNLLRIYALIIPVTYSTTKWLYNSVHLAFPETVILFYILTNKTKADFLWP